MNKMFAVIKREYLQAVRRKAFIIMTLLFPFLMAGMMIIPGLMMGRGLGEKKIAVLDGTGKLREAFTRPTASPAPNPKDEARNAMRGRGRGMDLPAQLSIEYIDRAGADVAAEAQPYIDRLTKSGKEVRKLDGVFLVPKNAVTDQEAELSYFSRSAADFMTQERLARRANRELQRMRLESNGISAETVDTLMRDLPVEAVQLSRTGEKKTAGQLDFLLGFVMAAMLLMPSLIYGTETMRGIIQEKNDRVVEVLISSLTPKQLLTGKIIGVALVGLTQLFAWFVMISIITTALSPIASAAGVNIAQFFRPIIFLYFVIFFVLAYLTYVCIYAVAGAVCNNEREAQQLIMPVMMLMLLPWILAAPIITNPDSPLAVGFSMSPALGPVTMFIRTTVSDPPMWHIAVSIAVAIVTILLFFYITAKIFRIGILSYGKRPTIPELMRWVRAA
jgi:ABC-2 type transport system permease protein